MRNTLILFGVVIGAVCGGALFHLGRKPITDKEPLVHHIVVTNFITNFTAEPFSSKPSLSWSGIESTNFFEYVHNLRSIGVPEKTIEDIIIADVTESLRERNIQMRRDLHAKYWTTSPTGKAEPSDVREQQLKDLFDEKKRIVNEILGYEAISDGHFPAFKTDFTSRYGYLEPDLRKKVEEVDFWFKEQVEQRIPKHLRGREFSDVKREFINLKREKDAQIVEALGEEEAKMFQLREHHAGSIIRFEFAGMELSEEEFLSVWDLILPVYDEEMDVWLYHLESDFEKQRRMEREREMREHVRNLVGEDRWKARTEYRERTMFR